MYHICGNVNPMMRPVHLRMARAALGLTVRELEISTGVNKNTISRYESGRAIFSDALEKLEAFLREEGIILIDDNDEVGIRVRSKHKPKGAPVASDNQIGKTKPKSSRKTIA